MRRGCGRCATCSGSADRRDPGKTTVATRLARRHGLRWRNADTRTWKHRDRALAAGLDAAQRWEAFPPDERWTLPPADLFELSLHRERGPMIVDDLRGLPVSPLIVADGSTVSPAVVSSGIAERSRAIWLVPAAEHGRERLAERRLRAGARALYALVAADIEQQASEHAVATFTIDGSLGIDETVDAIEGFIADVLAAGPSAETEAERRALLREANAAIVSQVRGYYARPWADGDADAVLRTFLCECGARTCAADVELPVEDAAKAPVLASGHGG